MAENKAFLELFNANEENCIICGKGFSKKDIKRKLTDTGWNSFIEQCRSWSDINIPVDNSHYLFPSVYEKVKGLSSANGVAHDQCRITLRTKASYYRER